MRNHYFLSIILCGCILMIFAFFLSTSCCAQWFGALPGIPYAPVYPQISDLFLKTYNPFFPIISPLQTIGAPTLNPILNPYLACLPTFSRNAAATIVVLPQPAPAVSAYAPLGTLNLTPSTLVFLILLFTLEG
ncbi:MAG: hypothetical protein ACMUIM_11995 [bacterium]